MDESLISSPKKSTRGPAQVIRVGVYENYPKVFTNEANQTRGFFPELLEGMAAQEGWTLQYVPGTWAEGLARLNSSAIDVMVDVGYSEERARQYVFTKNAALVNWGTAYQLNTSNIQTVSDLENQRVGVMAGDIHYIGPLGIRALMRDFAVNCTFVEYSEYSTVFEAVRNNSVAVGIVSSPFGLVKASEYDLKHTSLIFNPIQFMFAFPKTGELTLYLQGRIDYYLQIFKKDPDSLYYTLQHKYLHGIEEPFVLPAWVVPTVIILLIIIAATTVATVALVRGNQIKRRQIQVKQRMEAVLLKAKNSAEHANRCKSKFLATMSHELRTPLTAIVGFTEVLQDGLLGEITPKQVEFLQIVTDAAHHLTKLVNDILDLSKIQAGKMELRQGEFSLPHVARKALSLFQEKAAAHDLHLELDAPEQDPVLGHFVGDADKIKQVCINLLGNAVKFTPPGGQVGIRIEHQDRNVNVSIWDTGVGISEPDQEMLFRPFMQVGSQDQQEVGTGLGLVLSKKIVELHGGSIHVDSVVGKGSTFTFTLPLFRKASPVSS